MNNGKLNILRVSTGDRYGGAGWNSWDLFYNFRNLGYRSWLFVGEKRSNDPDVFLLPQSYWQKICFSSRNHFRPFLRKLDRWGLWSRKIASYLSKGGNILYSLMGIEDFDFPGTWDLIKLSPAPIDIIHCHNLHGYYFDLRALPWLCAQAPVILTLDDSWLLGGHCAHPFECERWKTGCGYCPHLDIYPAILRDATRYNWERKRRIYAQSRLYVTATSRWMMQKMGQSILAPAVIEQRVIPTGVDLSVFYPADKHAMRQALGIPQDTKVLLFVAVHATTNQFKDFQTLQDALAIVANHCHEQDILLIVLGEDMPAKKIGGVEYRFVSYLEDPQAVASYYQCADIYIHAAKQDTFPRSILEAMACGKPVVASAVGGIPEQIDDGVTGFLVAPKDAWAMAHRIEELIFDDKKIRHMGANAAEVAKNKFDLKQQINSHSVWYNEIVDMHKNITSKW